ncbi:hypothetical protein BaRGS_00003421 [Batillaria attramentaria]|uniref:Uncharacterized protein n=1 Tax=Batillaria attramentaria TaxID=370345 RepID=A0ABD0M0H6_9CAEN
MGHTGFINVSSNPETSSLLILSLNPPTPPPPPPPPSCPSPHPPLPHPTHLFPSPQGCVCTVKLRTSGRARAEKKILEQNKTGSKCQDDL